MVYPDHPCETPGLCDFDPDGKCRTCGKKSGPCQETIALRRLARRLDAGMPVGADGLAGVQWDLLARVRSGGLKL